MENEAADRVVLTGVDKNAILAQMHLDERISFSENGPKSFAYGLRAEIRGYDPKKWLIFHSLGPV